MPTSFLRPSFSNAVSYFIGIIIGLVALQFLPPAPAFSEKLSRATYLQSFETSYFASVRSYEAPIEKLLSEDLIPIVIFGDSSIRGTGATGNEVWSKQLERRLQAVDPKVRVLNYAQNAGDLIGPFLYHHLQKKYPNAKYIVQWHFPSEVGIRHQFHFWLSSEIALRDGNLNPAVNRSFTLVPAWPSEFTSIIKNGLNDEHYSFVLAALNIATNYLDFGNWFRYLTPSRAWHDSNRMVRLERLRDSGESDVSIYAFTPPLQDSAKLMREIFFNTIEGQTVYMQRPFANREGYFREMFPSSMRNNLLLLTTELNPYYAPNQDLKMMKILANNWKQLREDMALMSDLRWVAITTHNGELEINDFMDLGHFTPRGQEKIADIVAQNLLKPGSWFYTK